MANDPDAGPTVFVGASGEPVELRPVHGVIEDANGNAFNFILSVALSGPTAAEATPWPTGPHPVPPGPAPKVPVMPPKLIATVRLEFPSAADE